MSYPVEFAREALAFALEAEVEEKGTRHLGGMMAGWHEIVGVRCDKNEAEE